MRPAHVHFMIKAPGYKTLITHIFEEGDQHLNSDAVFAVKSSLITPFKRHEPGLAPDGVQDVAHLAHVEIFSPNMDGTLWFFKDLLGMDEVGRQGKSVYLRAYEDYYHNTLKVTEASQAGLGHAAFRSTSPQALERRVKA